MDLQEYWNSRYLQGQNSGQGSYGQEAVLKATMINHWIKEFNIRTVTEVGCGDANNLLMYNIPISYTGYDLSKKAIEICNQKTLKIRNALKYYFSTDYQDQNFDADLLLCLDVWFHQVNDTDFDKLCKNLFVDFKGQYIIIYSTDTASQLTPEGQPLASHMRQREVLSKIAEFKDWQVLYWISGIQINQDGKVNNVQFPSDKRFYLLKRLEVPKV
jgi:hypothetical protein